jgi:hypothetical protein
VLGSQIGYIFFLVVTEKKEIEIGISLKSTEKEKKKMVQLVEKN